VCFGQQNFKLSHCSKQVTVDFEILKRDPSKAMRYSTSVWKIEGNKRTLIDSGPSSNLSENKDPTPSQFRFKGDGEYEIEVTAALKGSDETTASVRKTIRFEPKIRGLIVGVARYDNGTNNPRDQDTKIRNLLFADQDAASFSKFLHTFFGIDAPPLLNHDADKNTILRRLEDLRGNDSLCEGDLLVFYFSGHTLVDDNSIRYVGTADADLDHINRGLSFEELYLHLKQISANKLVILDSCFSGLAIDTSPVPPPDVLEKGKALVVSHGKVVTDVPIPTPSEEQVRFVRQLVENFPGESFLVGAAEGNHEAQEGMLKKVNGKWVMTPDWTPDEVSEKSKGHGLYTYEVLSELERHMAKGHKHEDFADDDLGDSRFSTDQACYVDFDEAHKAATHILTSDPTFKKLQQRPQSYLFVTPLPSKFDDAVVSGSDQH